MAEKGFIIGQGSSFALMTQHAPAVVSKACSGQAMYRGKRAEGDQDNPNPT